MAFDSLQAGNEPRLKIVLQDNLRLDLPVSHRDADGVSSYDAYQGNVGEVYVVSAGRTDQPPTIVSDLILRTLRTNGDVTYAADFTKDGKFSGYTVTMTTIAGVRSVQVTGAATRAVPLSMIRQGRGGHEVALQLERASGLGGFDSIDVPSATGGFSGGAVGSGLQGYEHGARSNSRIEQ